MWIYVLADIKLIISQKILYDILMTIIIDVEVSGNNFQLSDDVNPTRKTSQASSRNETQYWSAYMIDVSGIFFEALE